MPQAYNLYRTKACRMQSLQLLVTLVPIFNSGSCTEIVGSCHFYKCTWQNAAVWYRGQPQFWFKFPAPASSSIYQGLAPDLTLVPLFFRLNRQSPLRNRRCSKSNSHRFFSKYYSDMDLTMSCLLIVAPLSPQTQLLLSQRLKVLENQNHHLELKQVYVSVFCQKPHTTNWPPQVGLPPAPAEKNLWTQRWVTNKKWLGPEVF